MIRIGVSAGLRPGQAFSRGFRTMGCVGHAARVLALALLALTNAEAANFYVRSGAAGSASGMDWVNAYSNLPSTLLRGSTYYVADGDYGAHRFNTPVNGTNLIIIRKATRTDHGTDVGWIDSYGDGSATWGGITVTTDYWLIDGQERASWTNGYGFVVDPPSAGKGASISGDHVTIQYAEFIGNGPDDAASPSDDGIYATSGQSALSFRYLCIRDNGRCPFLLRGLSNLLVEHCFIARNESHPSQHSEGVSLYGMGTANCVFRHNIWEDIEGTGVIVVGNATGCAFYGNLIYWTSRYPNTGQAGGYVGNGAITSWTRETHSNCLYYNNTVILPSTGGNSFRLGNMVGSAGTNNVSYNNLYFCAGTIGTRLSYDDGTAHDYNAYSGTSVFGEAHGSCGLTTGIFRDFAGGDFSLVAGTGPGLALPTPYAVDLRGVIRGKDGRWDCGAYEHVWDVKNLHVVP
ncbi:MAG: hypothetical protein BWX48_01461 [Verrucomicrobia bacterium ADurb.Bin006]|nr:MAG: hypothetical protein BWX48_01461 [Verrucomicrobia bacterium ADurb.Bin006]